mmetsp:Transcript_118225/g.294985  ORF Transcript_118225/g.294985 Transcript_118225/m.294985 type:complete len:170 (-) Transcript_118225:1126-1635(-)
MPRMAMSQRRCGRKRVLPKGPSLQLQPKGWMSQQVHVCRCVLAESLTSLRRSHNKDIVSVMVAPILVDLGLESALRHSVLANAAHGSVCIEHWKTLVGTKRIGYKQPAVAIGQHLHLSGTSGAARALLKRTPDCNADKRRGAEDQYACEYPSLFCLPSSESLARFLEMN